MGNGSPGSITFRGLGITARSLMALMSGGFRFDRARSGLHRRYLSCGGGNGLALFIAFFLLVEVACGVI
ncbi:hypothetical protein JTE90_014634 [Oedothorax gibbosus]|uniref:Uncharacterized protein n=1 Tax=Oedothorax gibbosus TaxID=931172 RepID=A0AAV6VAU8_9ARAC|nr:hypothetical protein JTE90_014634 [Oedothorax gibbosus]